VLLIPVTVSEGFTVLSGRCCATMTGEVVGTILAVALASHLFTYSSRYWGGYQKI